ncbi:IS256 family transposase [Guyparkeria sp.]|uniref:IS256 family transposase n=1 Tax=Guyparkeria sp. TaxID=2035736 RepID=UPI00397090EB
MSKIPPSERTRKALESLLTEGSVEEGDLRSELVRLSVEHIVEQALEAVARDVLGRGYYARREAQQGSRNGYRTKTMKSAEGAIPFAVPQVRDVSNEAIKAVADQVHGRTDELERLAVELYARGCSTRDIEAVFRDGAGKSLLSRTAVSEVTEALWEQYQEFATRDLSEVDCLYLFVDGIAERLRPGARREAVLAAWAITADGRKLLLHLSPGTKESTDCCRDFFEDMKRRGLGDPLLVVTDGAPGLIRAVEECFPASLRQRCLAHRMRNILAKVPEEIRAEFRQAAQASYQAPSPLMAQALRDDLVEKYEKQLPSAVKCFLEDFDACTAHLRCPPAHRKVIRTTNLLERLFLEERRRSRAAGVMFGERPVLKMMYASLIRASENWRGIRITEFEKRQIAALREQLRQEHRKENAPAVETSKKRSAPAHVYSKTGT